MVHQLVVVLLLVLVLPAACFVGRGLPAMARAMRPATPAVAAQKGDWDSFGKVVAPSPRIHFKAASAGVMSAVLALGLAVVPAQADEKSTKVFELCVSKCVFNDTKPPPVGSDTARLEASRGRAEIIRDCRKQCAKNKEQLMLGKPKIKAPAAAAAAAAE
ncbi:hypothetical protein B484DRAFT_449048 [Ochromonadaceae sp. CCMP2298]|nr:hypothetical protein B484DRAFT_449048 [Ochromonadaceae sp. CCMP2298]|mmetsp:Transcript_22712/g.50506  ORF Transcript_22712/g.50506 Transcript_22712/m.50506 type:complete len:160 (-) Transcript_22712:148-627(-)